MGCLYQQKNCGSDQMINSLSFGILQQVEQEYPKLNIFLVQVVEELCLIYKKPLKNPKGNRSFKRCKNRNYGLYCKWTWGDGSDADYGYVGTGKGKITLYKEQTVVEKNIPEDKAVVALINLIKQHGDWVEKN